MKKARYIYRVGLLMSWMMMGCLTVVAQAVPTPAPPQAKPIILQNGIIHTGTGEVIDRGDLLLIDGKITDVGQIRTRVTDAETIDLQGMHVYPGLIAPASQIGLDEIEAVRATEDKKEVGQVNPNARAIIGYNTDSRVTPTIRSNGILLAQVSPLGDMFSGTSTIVQLDAWNWEDAAYQPDDAVHLYWPSLNFRQRRRGPSIEAQKKRAKKRLQKLEEVMVEARAYAREKAAGKVETTDLRMEALVPVLEGKKPLFVHANTEKQLHSMLAFVEKHKVKAVLVGGADAWLVMDLLKKYDIPVILRKPQSLPRKEDDDIDRMYRLPKTLMDAGITVGLSMNDFWNQRNLPFQAGTAAAYGATKEEALQMVTLNTARILGIDGRTGSIEPGKDANIVVSKGDLLDMRTSKVELAFIQGRQIDLGNKQKDLYKKFGNR